MAENAVILGMVRRILCLTGMVGLAGCVGTDLVTCDLGLVCPAGDVCAPHGGRCVSPDQVDACSSRFDQDACTALGFAGLCQDGVCDVPSARPFSLQVQLQGTGAGIVTSPVGIDCGSICSADIPLGTTVVLTATPLNGSSFEGWTGSGSCSGPDACQLTVNSATTVGAFFNPPPAPMIVGVEPLAGGVGAEVVISGQSFAGVTAVTFNGQDQPAFTVTSLTTIETTVPAGAQSGPIEVVGPGGHDDSEPFTVLVADVALEGTIAPVTGCTAISFTVAQAESLPADVRVEVDPGSGTFQPATATFRTPGVVHVATAPGGLEYVFDWNSGRDVPHPTTRAKIRVTATVSGAAGNTTGRSFTRDVEVMNGAQFEDRVFYDSQAPSASWWQLADLNGDGYVDLVFGSSFADAAVALADARGGFLPPTALDLGGKLIERAGQVADVSGDGKPDLVFVVTDAESSSLWTLFGNGDGTFHSGPMSSLGTGGLSWMKIADFDRDGLLDVLGQPDDLGTAVGMARGNGDGTFSSLVVAEPDLMNASAPLVGDVNRDGRIDLVVLGANGVEVHLGDGTGQFSAGASTEAPELSDLVELADLDGDGKLDLVTTSSAAAILFRGNGDGSFAAGQTVFQGTTASGLAIGDVDLDGKPDIVAVISSPDRAVQVTSLDGIAEGTAIAPSSGRLIGIANLDADGRPDLIFLGSTMKNATTRYCGSSFVERPRVTVDLESRLAVTDVDRDGKLDLVGASPQGTLSVILGRGDGTFAAPVTFPGTAIADRLASGVEIAVADLDSDGKPDVLIGGSHLDGQGALSAIFGRGDGSFDPPVNSVVTPVPSGMVVTSVNGDASPDIVFIGPVATALGRSDRIVGAFSVDAGHAPCAVAGDFDGDGRTDLLCASPGSQPMAIVLHGSARGFLPGTPFNLGAFLPVAPVALAADFDHDGRLDLIVATDVFVGTEVRPIVQIFRNLGNGTFASPLAYPLLQTGVAPTYHDLVAADFDGDGSTDLAVIQDGNLVVLQNNGGSFDGPVPYGGDERLQSLAVGDFDGDGHPDLAATAPGEVRIFLWR